MDAAGQGQGSRVETIERISASTSAMETLACMLMLIRPTLFLASAAVVNISNFVLNKAFDS